MLNALFDLFKPKKQNTNQRNNRPLHVSRQIYYRTTPNHFFNDKTPDVVSVYENASKLPLMQNANLSFCQIDGGASFIGFNKPKKICGYVVVYPRINLKNDRTRLFKIAQKHGLNIGTLVLHGEQKCIQVKQGDKRYFLVNPTSLRLRDWSYKARPASELLPRPGR